MNFDIPVFQLKKLAKTRSRENNVPLNIALDQIAREQGFPDWHHLAFREKRERDAATIFRRMDEGDLLLLGARPRQGKTVLALQLLLKALRAGELGYVFSLEYTEAQVLQQLYRLGMKPDEFGLMLNIRTSDDICADYISTIISRHKRPAFVVIDFLQLLDQKRENPDIETQVGQLANLARASSSKVVVLSQIDRSFDQKNANLPTISNIRMPNTLNVAHFGKTCFIHNGEMHLSVSGE